MAQTSASALTLWLLTALLATPLTAVHAGVPAAYAPLVIEAQGLPERAEFDLSQALQNARQQNKRLYVYLGARDCPFCRRYEAFLDRHAKELVPQFDKHRFLVVDLRSALSIQAPRLFLRIGNDSRNYTDFQRKIGDERARRLVYPSVWVLDAEARPLMQMPGGTGTFETVEEQLEILRLEQ